MVMQVMEAKRRIKNECGLMSDVTSDSGEDKKKKKKAKGDVAEVYIIMESFRQAKTYIKCHEIIEESAVEILNYIRGKWEHEITWDDIPGNDRLSKRLGTLIFLIMTFLCKLRAHGLYHVYTKLLFLTIADMSYLLLKHAISTPFPDTLKDFECCILGIAIDFVRYGHFLVFNKNAKFKKKGI